MDVPVIKSWWRRCGRCDEFRFWGQKSIILFFFRFWVEKSISGAKNRFFSIFSDLFFSILGEKIDLFWFWGQKSIFLSILGWKINFRRKIWIFSSIFFSFENIRFLSVLFKIGLWGFNTFFFDPNGLKGVKSNQNPFKSHLNLIKSLKNTQNPPRMLPGTSTYCTLSYVETSVLIVF